LSGFNLLEGQNGPVPHIRLGHRATKLFAKSAKRGQSERMSEELDAVLAAVGPRLRELRRRRGVTLTALSQTTGIPISTLSRLESGQRRPGLELLLPLARAYRMPLDELVGAPAALDPRVHPQPFNHNGMTVIPLTRKPGGLQAFKQILPAGLADGEPDPRSHEGYHWLYVLNGRLRLVLGDQDLVLAAGEVAEFDTHLPHWFGNADARPVEFLSILGPQGERFHVRARYRPA
jgi:transcriptional regulator with XRE-family HTH domain